MSVERGLRIAHLGSAELRLRTRRVGQEHDVVDRDPELLGIPQHLGIALARQLEVAVFAERVVIGKQPHHVIALLLVREVVRLAELHVIGNPHLVLDPLWIRSVLQGRDQVRVAGVVIDTDQVRLHLLQRRQAQHRRHRHEGHDHAEDRDSPPHSRLALLASRHALLEITCGLGVGLDVQRRLHGQRSSGGMGNLAFLVEEGRLTFSTEHRRSPAWNGKTTGSPRPSGRRVP
ncbi:hypothetical protein D3C84_725060 [compost metagenome]